MSDRSLPVVPPAPLRGRGVAHDPPNRFDRIHVERDDWTHAEDPSPETRFLKDATRTIIARNDSPDVGFDVSVNPYRGCEHGCVYCLEPATPVLHADLMWRPIGEIREGDVLVGFDEYPEPGRTRKLRRTRVEHVWWSKQPTIDIRTETTEVRTTSNHRWLQWRNFRWTAAGRLEPGTRLRRIPVTDGSDVTASEGMRLPSVVRPSIGPRIDPLYGTQPAWKPDRVVAVEPGPVADVVDIQTSTGTFFAAGLATHNCYARPNHEYLGFSPGLDFETKILVKEDAPALLRKALSSPRWKPQPLGLSGVTDPYQPVERRLRITRRCLEVLAEFRNPVTIVTKNHMVTRDIDLLTELASVGAAHVTLSITTLRNEVQRVMEPRTSVPARRLAAIEALSRAGIPVSVNVAPVIPGLTDHEMPAILQAAADAGASSAAYIVLKLPYAVKDLFEVWLEQHFPDRAGKVINRLYSLRGGKLYDGRFGVRQRGEGPFAEQIRVLFDVSCRKAGLGRKHVGRLDASAFRRPASGGQGDLFDG